jgi:hypothetical protein
MPQERRFVRQGWQSNPGLDAVAGLKLNEMLKAGGVAAKAAILMLCVLVWAQALGAFAAEAHGSRPCHDRSSQPASVTHSHDLRSADAEHPHQGDHHASDAVAPEKARDHHDHAGKADGAANSHMGGCCGWLCSAATLPPLPVIRPAFLLKGAVSVPLAVALEDARLRGLFRPPRITQRPVA